MNKYIKVLDTENQVVDVLSGVQFVKWNNSMGMVVSCPDYDTSAEGILSSDIATVWHLFGKPEFPEDREYKTVTYVEIDKAEYDILRQALDADKNDSDNKEDNYDQADIEEPVDEIYEKTVEYVRNSKISEMSGYCNNVITRGIDVELSDGETYRFSLTTQDQLNLLTLSTLVASGQESIPYHADGELCKFYSAEDMEAVIQAATLFKSYQVTYFNALKAYIESLDSIEAIGAIEYGIDIPEEFQSDVLKVYLADKE